MAAFVKHGISVTCELDRGRTRWWLTKESGLIPAGCWEGLSCTRCCKAHLGSGSDGLRRPYLVVKVVVRLQYTAWSRCVFGALSSETLTTVVSNVVPPLAGLSLSGACEEGAVAAVLETDYAVLTKHLRALSRGSYSSGSFCLCKPGTTCKACCRCVLWRHKFVVQDEYCGVYPLGKKSWFCGPSDAVGEATSWRGDWMRPCKV
jgi:hypothetical protein